MKHLNSFIFSRRFQNNSWYLKSIVIFVFSFLLLARTTSANEYSYGEVHPRVLIDSNVFIVEYYNTDKKSYFENSYSINGQIIINKKPIPTSTQMNNIEEYGAFGIVPTGNNSPLGNLSNDYFKQYSPGCYYIDSTLYSLKYSAIPIFDGMLFLEIREKKNPPVTININWNRKPDNIDFQNCSFFVDVEKSIIVGTMSSGYITDPPTYDTLYMFWLDWKKTAAVNYKYVTTSSLPIVERISANSDVIRTTLIYPTKVKKVRSYYAFVFADTLENIRIAKWDILSGLFQCSPLNLKVLNDSSNTIKNDAGFIPSDFNIIGNKILVVWTSRISRSNSKTKVLAAIGEL